MVVMANEIDCILFDLGGVLVEFVGVPRILAWMGGRVDRDEMIRMWLYSQAVRGFETGRTSAREFAETIIEEFRFSVDAERFLEEFTYFPRGLYPGVAVLLQDLTKRYTLASLSNTNELHWDRLCREERFEELIQRNFPSHRTGFIKPDPEAFQHVLTELGCRPGRVLFFDDNPINVEAASAVDMQAVQVDGFDDLKQKLREMGIAMTRW